MPNNKQWAIVFFEEGTKKEYEEYFRKYPKQQHVRISFEDDVDSVGKPSADTNLYVYAQNDPVNKKDPLGLFVNNKCYWGCMTLVLSICGVANAPCLACLRLPPPANSYCVIICSGVMTGLCVAAMDDTCTKMCKEECPPKKK